MSIEIKIVRDYDDYFSDWAKKLRDELTKLDVPIKCISVEAGPYRSYGMKYNIEGDTLSLDFYSGVRNGFGNIGVTQEELAIEIKKLFQ